MPKISLVNVRKEYEDGYVAVKDFNLEINDGEFTVLVGPSGCGKSTTLRLIAGLEDITSGELLVDGVKQNDIKPKDRDLAMVFQSYALYPHMSVYDNMAFALQIKKLDKDEINRRVRNAADILGLEDHLEKRPGDLSGGQRQRVALGRAIVREPGLFLMDEPLSNLDAKLRVQTRSEIIQLHKNLGNNFIYVTHDQTEALTMGDRIVIMNEGIVQQCDTPDNVYNHPANLFVASFIGSPQMTFFVGEISRDEKALIFETSADAMHRFKLTFSEVDYPELLAGCNREVILGCRPEDMSIVEVGQGDFDCEINLIEQLGSEQFIYDTTSNSSVCVRGEKGQQFTVGQKIGVRINPPSVHVFDKQTEKAYF